MNKSRHSISSLWIFFSIFFLVSCATLATPETKVDNGRDPSAFSSEQFSFDQIRQAAEAGDPDAQYALGYMYYYGKGITKNNVAAKEWIHKAANQGQAQAVQAEKLLRETQGVNRVAYQPVNRSGRAESRAEIRSDDPASSAIQDNTTQTTPDLRANQSAQRPTQPTMAQANNAKSHRHFFFARSKPRVSPNPAANSSNQQPGQLAANQNQAPSPQKVEKAQEGQHQPVVASNTANDQTEPQRLASKTVAKNVNEKTYYSLQLLGSQNKQDILSFMQSHHLQNQASFYRTMHNNKEWYVLIYGKYQSRTAAGTALAKLSPKLKQRKPWVKSSNVINEEKQLGQG